MPMFNSDGSLVIVYNGGSTTTLGWALAEARDTARSNSDTEAILYMYQRVWSRLRQAAQWDVRDRHLEQRSAAAISGS